MDVNVVDSLGVLEMMVVKMMMIEITPLNKADTFS